MQLIQYTGPFQSGQEINIPSKIGTTYIHIGVQMMEKKEPTLIPITTVSSNGETTYTNKYKPMRPRDEISINGQVFHLNDRGIIEFDDLGEMGWTIKFLHYFPPETIVDIIIKEEM